MVVRPCAKLGYFFLALFLLSVCDVNCSPVFTRLKNKSSFNGRKVANVEDEPHQQVTPSRQSLVINDNLHAPPPTRDSSPTRTISGHLRGISLDSSEKAPARMIPKANGRSVKVESDEEERSTHSDDDDYYHDFAEASKRNSAENSPSTLYHSPWSDHSFSARYPTANQITEAMQNRVQQSQGPSHQPAAHPRPRMRTRLDYFTPFMGFAPPVNYGHRH
jgi:hypothetical protein